MAVVYNVNGFQKMKELGVAPALLAELSAMKATLSVTPKGVQVKLGQDPYLFEVHHEMLSQAVKTKNVKLKTAIEKWLLAVKMGKALPLVKVEDAPLEVQGDASSALIVGVDPAAPGTDKTVIAEMKPAEKPGYSGSLTVPNTIAPNISATIENEPVSTKLLLTLDPVPLIDAKGLYRPVRGSSGGSRYFLIAVFPTYKMAARLKEGSISLRVEGNPPADKIKELEKFGFQKGGTYWSTHTLPAPSIDDVQMFVGAMLSKLGDLLTPLPNLKLISGKGA